VRDGARIRLSDRAGSDKRDGNQRGLGFRLNCAIFETQVWSCGALTSGWLDLAVLFRVRPGLRPALAGLQSV
jgi:hypothetical protein